MGLVLMHIKQVKCILYFHIQSLAIPRHYNDDADLKTYAAQRPAIPFGKQRLLGI